MAKQKDLGNLESLFGNTVNPVSPKRSKTNTASDGCKEGEKRFTTILPQSIIQEIKELSKSLGLPVKDIAQAAFSKYLNEKRGLLEQKKAELEKQTEKMEKLRKELLE